MEPIAGTRDGVVAGARPRDLLRFRTKIDWWVFLIFGAMAYQLLVMPVVAFFQGMPLSLGHIGAALLILGTLVWLGRTTLYDITSEDLVVRWGPFRTRIPLASIYKLRATRSLASSPALSLDRIEVLTRNAPCGLVSPADKAGFVQAIRARAPHVEVEGIDA